MITVSTIANASDIQLLCITYELFIEHIKEAVESKGDRRKVVVDRAKDVLITLTENLNLEIAIAQDLFKIYIYVQNLLINHSDNNDKLIEAQKLIDTICIGYKQIETHVNITPSIENAQSIYAGMTYGRGYLNEVVMDVGSRGFRA